MKTYITTFFNYRYLLKELVVRGIRLKYRHSYLGIIWTLLEPLLMMIILTIVFGTLYGRTKDFSVYILTGRLMFSFFSSSTRSCVKSIRAHASIIKKVYVPKYFYPLSMILHNYVMFLISLLVLAGVMIVLHIPPTWFLLQAFIPLLLIFFLSYGIGMILATVGVFFRDMEYLWSVMSMVIMYTSAIFYYPDSLLSSGYAVVLKCNPVFAIIQLFRSAVFGTRMDSYYLIYATCFSLVSVLLGTLVFKKKQDEFILHI